MDSNKSISTALVTTVRSADIGGLAKDYAEVALDSVLSEGIFRDLPVLSTIIAVSKIGISINDQIFAKKLIRFLSNLSEIDAVDRSEMIDRLDNEDGFSRKVGDRIIELLNRVDSHAKPEMLAKAFRAYATRQIDGGMLNRLNYAIERLPRYEIQSVRAFYEGKDEDRQKMPEDTLFALSTAGLARATSGWEALVYIPNRVCTAFVTYELDKQ